MPTQSHSLHLQRLPMKSLTVCLLDFDGANKRDKNEIVLVKKDWLPSLKAKTICDISFSCLSKNVLTTKLN